MEIIIGNYDRNKAKEKEIFNKKIDLFYKNFKNGLIENDCKKIVYYGIMYFYRFDKSNIKTIDDLNNKLYEIYLIKNYMKTLTFNDIINLFPIKKDYDGKKFECKDYFSTSEYLNTLNLSNIIGNNIDDFFWNYYNNAIMGFSVKELLLIDMARMLEGKESLMTEFARNVGVDTYTINKEQGYIYNNTTKRTIPYKPVRKKIKYIKIIKKL